MYIALYCIFTYMYWRIYFEPQIYILLPSVTHDKFYTDVFNVQLIRSFTRSNVNLILILNLKTTQKTHSLDRLRFIFANTWFTPRATEVWTHFKCWRCSFGCMSLKLRIFLGCVFTRIIFLTMAHFYYFLQKWSILRVNPVYLLPIIINIILSNITVLERILKYEYV